MDFIQAPIVLLASTYGSYTAVIKAYELLNAKRDQILDFQQREEGKALSPLEQHKRMDNLYRSDWLPFQVCNVLFMVILVGIDIAVPIFFASDPALEDSERTRLSYWLWGSAGLCALLPIFGTIGFVIGAWQDARLLQAAIASVKVRALVGAPPVSIAGNKSSDDGGECRAGGEGG